VSYEIIVKPTFTLVRLYAEVGTIDLLKSHEEPVFLRAIEKTPTVVYDYSDADNVFIDQKGAVHLAELANHIARYQAPLHIIIIPQDLANTTRPELYKATVASKDITVDIVDDLESAFVVADKYIQTE
jgi:hypothetical protein